MLEQISKKLLPWLGLLAVWLFSLPSLGAQAPAWWSTYGVLNTSATADDYSAINQGQAKNIASKARTYLNAALPGGAGTTVNAMVDSWSPPTALSDDYAVLTVGQLKNLAQPFYDRLMQVGFTTTFPWTAITTDDDSYVAANIGQAKYLFSFSIGARVTPPPVGNGPDSDGDGLSDEWEIYYFGNLNQTGGGDADSDGISNMQEFADNSDPTISGLNPNDHTPPVITLNLPTDAALLYSLP